MNGYKMQSIAYKKYLEDNPDTPAGIKAGMENKIKLYDFLGECTKSERLELFNSSAFNDVVKGYLLMAADNLNIDEATKSDLLKELNSLFDNISAEQAENYYKNH